MNEGDIIVNRLIGGLECGLLYAEKSGTAYFLKSYYFKDTVWVLPEENSVRIFHKSYPVGVTRRTRLVDAIEDSLKGD